MTHIIDQSRIKSKHEEAGLGGGALHKNFIFLAVYGLTGTKFLGGIGGPLDPTDIAQMLLHNHRHHKAHILYIFCQFLGFFKIKSLITCH